MKNIVILYHAECPDGFGAAWATYKKLGDDAEYIGVYHNSPFPEGLKDKNIYLLDFCYPEKETKELMARNKSVTAIDHHVSREGAIKMTENYSYSVDNSGSVLSWKYFNKDVPVPSLLRYVEDGDLWRFAIPNSRVICAFINTLDYDFQTWNKLAEDLEDEDKNRQFTEQGGIIIKYEGELVRRLIKESARPVMFEGYETLAVNAPHMLASDVGHGLYEKKPPIAIVWSEDKNRVNVSLRSDGTVDVSKIASKFGGGGHKAAAGFSLPSIDALPWSDLKK